MSASNYNDNKDEVVILDLISDLLIKCTDKSIKDRLVKLDKKMFDYFYGNEEVLKEQSSNISRYIDTCLYLINTTEKYTFVLTALGFIENDIEVMQKSQLQFIIDNKKDLKIELSASSLIETCMWIDKFEKKTGRMPETLLELRLFIKNGK